jgi:hypothetical protein
MRHETHLAPYTLPQQLAAYLQTNKLTNRRRNSIAYLPMGLAVSTKDCVIVREGLKTAKLSNRKLAISPVKGAGSRAWLSLNCPGWPILCKLEKKRPKSSSPSKQR